MAEITNIDIDQIYDGEDVVLTFTVVDEEDEVENITGYTVVMGIATEEDGIAFKLINGNVPVGTDGIVTIPIASTTDMDDFEANVVYWYTLWRTNSSNKRVLAKGRFVISPAVALA